MKIIEDSNSKIVEKDGKFIIIDITTGKKHADCEYEFFNTKEEALDYWNREI